MSVGRLRHKGKGTSVLGEKKGGERGMIRVGMLPPSEVEWKGGEQERSSSAFRDRKGDKSHPLRIVPWKRKKRGITPSSRDGAALR